MFEIMTVAQAVRHTDVVPEIARVTVEELARDTARVLERVEAGEQIWITRDDKLLAVMLPIDPVEQKTRELIAAGILPADWQDQQVRLLEHLRDNPPPPPHPGQRPLSEVLIEMRNEEDR